MTEESEYKQFKSFRETYRLLTFSMDLSMIYPNPRTERIRFVGIILQLLSAVPMAAMVGTDMYNSWLRRDIVNIIRHSTVLGPLLAGFFKMILNYLKRKEAEAILEEINHDYESYNHMPDEDKELSARGIRNSLIYSERCWVAVVLTCVMVFPLMAIVETTYSYAFAPEPAKTMVHDMNILFLAPERRFDSPQYEIVFAYQSYIAILYVITFIGYDGFFGICINHACMKMEQYCKALEDSFKGGAHPTTGIVRVIHLQCRMFDFVDLIQDVFNIWLGLIFLATMIQICTCLYHISEGYGFDPRYTVFVVGAVIHIYLPCRYAANLKVMSVETSNRIYCCGWERSHDLSVRKMITFMIARAQKPIEITAFNMIVFDMDLFVSILQTSYSMYTLLSS